MTLTLQASWGVSVKTSTLARSSSSSLRSNSRVFTPSASCSGPWLWRWRQWFSHTPQTWGRLSEPSGAAWPPGLYTNQEHRTSCKKVTETHVNQPSRNLLSVKVQRPTYLILSLSSEKMFKRLPIKPPFPPLYCPNWWETIKQLSLLSFQGTWVLWVYFLFKWHEVIECFLLFFVNRFTNYLCKLYWKSSIQ